MMDMIGINKEGRKVETFGKYELLRDEKIRRMDRDSSICRIDELFPDEYDYHKDKLKTITTSE